MKVLSVLVKIYKKTDNELFRSALFHMKTRVCLKNLANHRSSLCYLLNYYCQNLMLDASLQTSNDSNLISFPIRYSLLSLIKSNKLVKVFGLCFNLENSTN